jgi:hypothetical protein
MKALITALALVTLIAGPTFAQSAAYTHEHEPAHDVSPASSNFGDNGN